MKRRAPKAECTRIPNGHSAFPHGRDSNSPASERAALRYAGRLSCPQTQPSLAETAL
jgi:hypothetical protein